MIISGANIERKAFWKWALTVQFVTILKYRAMKTYGRVEVKLHAFLSSAVNEDSSRSGRFDLGGLQSRSGRVRKEKIPLPLPGNWTLAVNHYTDWAIPSQQNKFHFLIWGMKLWK
jgi:hypothetical protein